VHGGQFRQELRARKGNPYSRQTRTPATGSKGSREIFRRPVGDKLRTKTTGSARESTRLLGSLFSTTKSCLIFRMNKRPPKRSGCKRKARRAMWTSWTAAIWISALSGERRTEPQTEARNEVRVAPAGCGSQADGGADGRNGCRPKRLFRSERFRDVCRRTARISPPQIRPDLGVK